MTVGAIVNTNRTAIGTLHTLVLATVWLGSAIFLGTHCTHRGGRIGTLYTNTILTVIFLKGRLTVGGEACFGTLNTNVIGITEGLIFVFHSTSL